MLFRSGISVSRVGGSAQIKGMKKVAGSLRLDLAQYRELEAFSAFASDLDAASKAQLDRGARLVELLKQKQFSPMPVEEQIGVIYLGSEGYLDSVPTADITRFEAELLDYLRRENDGILGEIKQSKALSDEDPDRLAAATNEFKKQFESSDGSSVVPEEKHEAMAEGDEESETVRIKKSGK